MTLIIIKMTMMMVRRGKKSDTSLRAEWREDDEGVCGAARRADRQQPAGSLLSVSVFDVEHIPSWPLRLGCQRREASCSPI